MGKKLVIVESPAKARTISNFLGKDFIVKASMGHVRDLPASKLGVDVEDGYKPEYTVSTGKRKVITDLNKILSTADELWIATDEDREGEAIGWHLIQALKVGKKPVYRIVFHEITKTAITAAVEHPRDINNDLVDAQQARRILDRLVGYGLSPLLWTKIRYGLSAGRVQSVAVRLIVDREREIKAFVEEEYWSITALLHNSNKEEFPAHLVKIDGNKFASDNEGTSKSIVDQAKKHTYTVESIKHSEQKRSPKPPFITSTLQQDAGGRLRFPVGKTMMIAQQLYEGIEGMKNMGGLITYMRTDSVNMAMSAKNQARDVIAEKYGKEFVPDKPRGYKSKKGAQEAHEAIRPVDFSLYPEKMKDKLSSDQFKLYKLIWERAIASQMADAVYDKMAVVILSTAGAESFEWHANGKKEKFAGFTRLYQEVNTNGNEDEEEEGWLPALKNKEVVDLQKLLPQQHFTKPPARYTEAALVKTLEKEGIGRPSTYAPIISTIVARGYIEKEKQYLVPTDTAFVVNDMLVEHFADVVDLHFTARMEEHLDEIAEGKKEWVPVIDNFYKPFSKLLKVKKDSLGKQNVLEELENEVCPQCGGKVQIKLGRYGKFKSCANYPECKFAEPLEKPDEVDIPEDKKTCEKCGGAMQMKTSRFGSFLGCSNYPECKNIVKMEKELDVECPICKKGKFVEKRTRKGKVFYGCSAYPTCKTAVWDEPVNKVCELCGNIFTKKGKSNEHCSNKECGNF